VVYAWVGEATLSWSGWSWGGKVRQSSSNFVDAVFPTFKYAIVCKSYEVKDCCQCLNNVSELYFD